MAGEVAIVWVITSRTGSTHGTAESLPLITRLRARRDVWLPVLGGLLVVWSLVAAIAALRAALDRQPDRMAEQDAEFRAFATHLPASGTIGYLQPFDGWVDDSVRTHYAAQYSLAPRVVAESRAQEFLIVASGAARPGGDPRLDGFVEVASFPGGHRLFRRFP